MAGLVHRGYGAGDAAPVAQLLNLVARHAGGPAWAVPAAVDSLVVGAVPDPATGSRLVFTGSGTLVAAALVLPPPAGGWHVDLWPAGVHPKWRGRGLGRELLGWQLARAAEIHTVVAPAARWEAHAAVLSGDRDAARLLRRCGFAPARHWFDMVAPTSPQAPGGTPPGGLRFVPYTPARERDLHAAHVEAFAGHWGFQHRELAQWAALTIHTDRFAPELSVLALDGDELAGYVLSYRDADPDRLYIGQVGVRPGWRRRGVAGALLTWALHAAGEAGMSGAWLSVDADSPTGAVGVYERAGFTVASRSVTYTTPLPGTTGAR